VTAQIRNIFSTPEGDGAKLVVIPSDYLREGVVPICIRTTDDAGNPVYRGWIDAVRPIAGQLRFLARTVIRDVWRVSELTEGSVHMLSAKHGQRMGRRPDYRIYRDAKWRARDMAAGDRRIRVRREVRLLEGVRAVIQDPYDFVKDFENRELFTRLQEELRAANQDDVLLMMQMYLSDSDDDIAGVFGAASGAAGYRAKNTLYQRFRRGLRRAAKALRDQMDNPAA
jgi:hypothetical protein